ncbi:hypothetical protein NFI96_027823 [Prochilodus magdalenae]|nr:hypothetical protein NFI96_027823 [Prochilodus magdalenae]
MRVCPRPLLLGLLIIFYLQSCVDGQRQCCFGFNTKQIPLAMIGGYEVTGPYCAKHGVIFYSKKGRVCMDPSSKWVRRAMDIIDRRIVEVMTVCPRSLLLDLLIVLYLQSCVEGQNGLAPEECCFRFYTRSIPVAEITEYKITGADCEKPGVVFYTKKGPVCMNPSSRWVQRAMDIIDRRTFEDGLAPEECCFRFYTRSIPVTEISRYEETGPRCRYHGVIFTTTKGPVCVDPSSKWVQRAMDKINRRIIEGSD